MNYLNDYLKVIPKADSDIIMANIHENSELFEYSGLMEDDYEILINQLIQSEDIVTEIIELNEIITAEDFNSFYSNVALDLHRIFPEQNNIEKLGESYDRIYQGSLDELSYEIEKLRESINLLSAKESLQKDTITESYSFEPDKKEQVSEILNEDTKYLFVDRDGKAIAPAEQEKLFHTYHLTLSKNESINVLVNDSGITTAKIDILYESPYVLSNTNKEYSTEKILDGDTSTFWFNVAKKPDNSLDYVNIMPGRTKEEAKYVRDTE